MTAVRHPEQREGSLFYFFFAFGAAFFFAAGAAFSFFGAASFFTASAFGFATFAGLAVFFVVAVVVGFLPRFFNACAKRLIRREAFPLCNKPFDAAFAKIDWALTSKP
jgi:hypothetical protein